MKLLFALSALAALFHTVEADSFPRVRIFNPKEGDIWFAGQVRTIVWRMASLPPPPDPPTLNITLARKNDTKFRLPLVVGYDTNRLGYQWRIPQWLPTSTDYFIRILPNRAFPKPGRPNIQASKSKPFTIIGSNVGAGISVMTPAKGAVWYSGQFRYIRWKLTSTNPVGASVSIFIEETKNGMVGRPYPYEVAKDLAVGNDGVAAFNWQVPYSFRRSSAYQLTLVAEFNDGRAPVQGKSELFTIIQVGDASTGTPIVILPTPEPTA